MPHDTTALKAEARRLGFDVVGVCSADLPTHWEAYRDWIERGFHGSMEYLERHLDLKRSPSTLLPGVRSIVAVGLNYRQPVTVVAGQPRIAAYAQGRDYHKVLRGKLNRLSSWIAQAISDAECRVCVDSAPIFEREYAHLAGLGWFGKNTCLIDSKRGSWFFIGLLLTTAELASDKPAIGGCGSCNVCIDACPTGAIVFEDGRWQVDSKRCISYLTIEHRGPIARELEEKMGDWTFGCDVCQDVCPFNRPRESQPLRAVETREEDFLTRRRWPNLVELAQVSESDWDRLTAGSPVRRTGIAGLRRNAAINLQNSTRATSTCSASHHEVRGISLPGGSFLMGSEDSCAYFDDGEGPVRSVTLSPFVIDAYPVTNEDFGKFVAETGYRTEAEQFGWSFVFWAHIPEDRFQELVEDTIAHAPWWCKVPGAAWDHPEGPGSGIEDRSRHPVVHVSWNDAVAYSRWAGKSLPTEAQWEYAARGGLEQKRYPWGDELNPDGRHLCNIWQGEFPLVDAAEDGFAGTCPVDAFPPNGYGLYSVTGNTWEWCADWFHSSHALEPTGGSAKVMKGGSFLCHESYCHRYRVAARTKSPPDSSSSNVGFRCASSLGA